jgi:hypothetical protein
VIVDIRICKNSTVVELYKRRLKVFKKWELKRKFGPKRDDVTWEWRKIQNL